MKVLSNSLFASRLSALSRLWTLRRAPTISAVASDASVIGLGLASLALWIGLDWWRAEPGAQFDPLAVPIVALYALLVLGAAFVLSRTSRPGLDYQSALFIVVAWLPIGIACGFMIAMRLEGRSALVAWALLSVYALAYCLNALRSLTGVRQGRAVLIAAIGLAALYPFSQSAELSPWLWSPPSAAEEEDPDMPPLVAESLLFDQRDQIDQAVDGMRASTGREPGVFFVGFAGVANQRVFAEEIKLAARVVDERFATSDRQLLLMNDRRDLDTYPIATVSGLSYALRAVAQKMDPERDILFLALSSHGSADPALSVSNGGLPLEQLTDDDLQTALRESGIKRRIVVISACYAGAFIKPLENPDTVVITAASADRTSFGCSDDRDLTYFGEAFYRDALPGARTLQEAFEKAKAAIAVREREENETPSEPQAVFGREISAVLERNPMRIVPRGGGLRARLSN